MSAPNSVEDVDYDYVDEDVARLQESLSTGKQKKVVLPKRKKRKSLASDEEDDEVDVRLPRLGKPVYRKEHLLWESGETKSQVANMSLQVWDIPYQAAKVPDHPVSPLERKQKQVREKEKAALLESQRILFQQERLAEEKQWKALGIPSETQHFVWLREGGKVVKWYPRATESLASLCVAIRSRMRLPRTLSHCLYKDKMVQVEVAFAQDKAHRDLRWTSDSMKSPLVLSQARTLLPLTTCGINLCRGSLVDVLLPQGVLGMW